ncbi:BrnA antitoxin family protein [Rhodopila sp.]|uniref:BrnA antitoxin family protein n=1 Tax=Rhodopila sp. TaxID=2480087 RepID=UPI003D0DE3BA
MKAATSKSRTAASEKLDPKVLTQLRKAAALPDQQIDLSDPDAPEVRDWSGAVRRRFYKPVKKLKSLRIDADVLAFFEAQGPGYQTRINQVLRQAMLQALQRSGHEPV